jgi:hypothetical protein
VAADAKAAAATGALTAPGTATVRPEARTVDVVTAAVRMSSMANLPVGG